MNDKPQPKFKIGDEVCSLDGTWPGTIESIEGFDDYIGTWRYRVRDTAGHRKYRNELGMHLMCDDSKYISFGDVCRQQLGMQCQYGSRYVTSHGSDLRIIGEVGFYHGLRIHCDDVDTFVMRVKETRAGLGL